MSHFNCHLSSGNSRQVGRYRIKVGVFNCRIFHFQRSYVTFSLSYVTFQLSPITREQSASGRILGQGALNCHCHFQLSLLLSTITSLSFITSLSIVTPAFSCHFYISYLTLITLYILHSNNICFHFDCCK